MSIESTSPAATVLEPRPMPTALDVCNSEINPPRLEDEGVSRLLGFLAPDRDPDDKFVLFGARISESRAGGRALGCLVGVLAAGLGFGIGGLFSYWLVREASSEVHAAITMTFVMGLGVAGFSGARWMLGRSSKLDLPVLGDCLGLLIPGTLWLLPILRGTSEGETGATAYALDLTRARPRRLSLPLIFRLLRSSSVDGPLPDEGLLVSIDCGDNAVTTLAIRFWPKLLGHEHDVMRDAFELLDFGRRFI